MGKRKSTESRTKSGTVKLSPSAMELLNKCEAGFIYSRCILPKMRTSAIEKLTGFGSSFHEAVEKEFDSDVIDVLEHTGRISSSERDEIESMQKFVEKIPFLSEVSEVQREVNIELKVSEACIIRGIIDYLGKADDKIIIADWKTSSFVRSTARDLRQLMTYAYMYTRLYDVDPSSIRLVIVYPRAMEYREFEFNADTLAVHERYITSMIRRASQLISEYENGASIDTFTHVVGECGICPMKGRCVAYRIVANPVDVGDEVESVDELIDEYFAKRELMKICKERVDAIEEALMERLDPDSPYANDDDRKTILDHFSVIRRSSNVVALDEYVDRVLVPTITKAVRTNALVRATIDSGAISTVLKTKLKKVIGKDIIDAKKVQDEDVSLTVQKKEGRPFLQPR